MNVLRAIITWFLALYAIAFVVFLAQYAAAGHPLRLTVGEALEAPADLILRTIDFIATAVSGRAVLR